MIEKKIQILSSTLLPGGLIMQKKRLYQQGLNNKGRYYQQGETACGIK